MSSFPRLRFGDGRRRRVAVGVVALALAAVGTAAAVTTRATVAPSNNSLPTIGGTVSTGSTLTANPGTWAGSTPITFQYQWRICNEFGAACHDIAGATAQTYVLKQDDAGNTLTVRVIAGNGDGSATATSPPSSRVTANAPGPVNTAAPTVSGTTTAGATLTANPGNWNGSGRVPVTFTYQWTICGAAGESCHDIAGATSQTYVLKADDAGNTLRVRVVARDSNGTTQITSAPTARIAAAGSGGGTAAPGCPSASGSQTIAIQTVAAPARLQVAQFQLASGPLTLGTQSFSARFRVTDTCGRGVSGALVYPAAVPYNQFSTAEATTDASGWVTMTFNRRAGYPASPKQRQLTMFVRARKSGEPLLAGVSTRRLVAFQIGR